METNRISGQQKDIIAQMRNNNIGYREIAKILNCNKGRVRQYCRRNNLGGFRGKDTSLTEEKVLEIIKNKHQRFEYIGGYTGVDGYVYLMCKDCGHIFKHGAQPIKPSNHKNIRCDNCVKILKQKKENDIQTEKARIQEQRELAKQKALKEKQIIKICVECGEQFTTSKKSAVCCSCECSKKRANNRKDRRLHKCEVVDCSITLSKLVKRDKGVCHICGKKVDMTADSNSGRYGSIDHVKAIANGGNHTWDNVKLAHRHCNTIKSTKKYAEARNGQMSMYI